MTEKNHRSKTELISDSQELYRFLATPGMDVVNLLYASHRVVLGAWNYADEERIPNLRHTNDVFGSFVTAGSTLIPTSCKIEQFTQMQTVIYIQKDEAPLIECDDYLVP